ncbi:MAG: CCA tRNA nucleotidyltransferase [Elusimicrobia bacterium]|nr:CCA tRNA nucleotidyltransferase [Elusimicrobiota bacterium]
MSKRLRLPAVLVPVVRLAAGESARLRTPAFAVGGCVRDWLLGLPTKDLDVVLESDPGPLAQSLASRVGGRVESFDRFGTLRLLGPRGLRVDFARARAESYEAPAALPVVRPALLRDDLVRRDFSVNAMAAPLERAGLGPLLDPWGGRDDLRRGVLRVLHGASFRDDPTRLYRAARFAARFGFRLDPETERLRREASAGPGLLSRERLRGELWRFLEEADPEPALRMARAWRLDVFWHPRLRWPRELGRARDPLVRLTLIALAMGPGPGAELVRSLHLERGRTQAALAALEVARRRASPRLALPDAAAEALRLKLAPKAAALSPLMLDGADLGRLGLPPGPSFSKILDRAARAQWAGEFSTRAAALRWLRETTPCPRASAR